MKLHMGLDVGSTTVKLVVLNQKLELLYSTYRRHFSDVKKTVKDVMNDCYRKFKYDTVTINVTGSGGLSVHESLEIPFIQEVVAGTEAIKEFLPQTDVAIELGGEDSKITYLKDSLEQRMNSICAGGTGAFIDQMASLLETDAGGLNELAKEHKKIYPIASRCGVFAKTDVQALVNQGATKADIAGSVFQSVVNQTISNLACGRPIEGRVAFLGGPLHFLSELRSRFIETLELGEEEALIPENSELFVALGAAIGGMDNEGISFLELYQRAQNPKETPRDSEDFLPPLFSSKEEYEEFKTRHETDSLPVKDIEEYEGPMYLGIDAGSTTSKMVLLGENKEILYTFYGSNKGSPLEIIREKTLEILSHCNEQRWIAAAGSTGYGEDFIKSALGLDFGEVETIAHFKAAKFFEPEVDFILDIGGQDMKSMRIKDGVIESILLNEACSSGCGSFLEAFANTVQMSVEEFSKVGLLAKHPMDLGSRCTVFMNSLVKKAQKDGAEVGDIAAGLAYSVIKNAIQKVIKIRDPRELGEHIVVQGGTFYGDAVLRAFELITEREVIRPNIAGLMGALGMALIGMEKGLEKSSILSRGEMETLSFQTRNTHCNRCTNQCPLTIHLFSNGNRFITGNRCERGAGVVYEKGEEIPNLYAYKLHRLFDYRPLEKERAKRGTVGIPRVLNMYENYPFWFRFFTELGYHVVLSDMTTRKLYEEGMKSIISETACYPAKISHGHIENLVKKDVDFIFYPSIFYEEQTYESADNTLNCPVVAGYPEVIAHNVSSLKENNIPFLHPFLSFDHRKKLEKRLGEVFKDIPYGEIKNAVRAAYREQDEYREDVAKKGRETLQYLEENHKKGIVLAGRPYHVDPEINHGVPGLITSLGLAVLSEDSIAGDVELEGRLRVLDQWNYHSKLYRSAQFVGEHKNLEMVQLNSFGCGLDAVTTDQVNEILASYHKIYTVLKIDEVNNLGAVKIRLRSLLEAVEEREIPDKPVVLNQEPLTFTKEMKEKHTLLLPQMSPIHFSLIEPILSRAGFNVKVLEKLTGKVVNEGLKYVNNDACYPSIFVVGQFIEAIKSGRYDTDNLTLIISQTGGACRASNYVAFIRKALKDAGYENIPVLALSAQGIEKHPGIDMRLPEKRKLLKEVVMGLLYGDLVMRLVNKTRPYERIKGSANILKDRWLEICAEEESFANRRVFRRNVQNMIREFEQLETTGETKPKVGIVGEILVKYLPAANNNLQELLEEEGVEVVISDLTDFLMYSFRNSKEKWKLLSKGMGPYVVSSLAIQYIESYRQIIRQELETSTFDAPETIETLVDYAEEFVSLGHQYGEGWLLTAEMVELIHQGAGNIVCVQPFGCLPNHITGKGVIRAIREKYPTANIVPIDYDASASSVNQLNRVKLMLSQAVKNKEKNRRIEEEARAVRNQ
ncbi:MAG: acyl-CoA dehydratase activase-related protein [Tissierellia bacterium]|nr:acyl-CoA dehydratase activase-related protein [Tissierellia bacterium]